jgi:hypothetical protein
MDATHFPALLFFRQAEDNELSFRSQGRNVWSKPSDVIPQPTTIIMGKNLRKSSDAPSTPPKKEPPKKED